MKYPLIVSAIIGLGLFALTALGPGPTSYAYQGTQATPRPTATNIGSGGGGGGGSGSGGGGGDRDDTPVTPPLVGVVQGYVYDYSAGGMPQPGIPVIVDGGGWQAETLTDSNGFYQFAGLGSGQATLNLRLPPGTRQVLPDWPVHTSNPEGTLINLAYYWGEVPPLPVILSLNPQTVAVPVNQEFIFEVLVHNQSGGQVTNLIVDLQLPSDLEGLEGSISHGQTDFTRHRIWGLIDQLANGETAKLAIRAKFDQGNTPQALTAKAILNYQEQLTPQLVSLSISGGEPADSVAPSSAPVSRVASIKQSASPADGGGSDQQSGLPATGGILENSAGSDQAAQPAGQAEAKPEPNHPPAPVIEAAPETESDTQTGLVESQSPEAANTGSSPNRSRPETDRANLITWLVFGLISSLILGMSIVGVKMGLR